MSYFLIIIFGVITFVALLYLIIFSYPNRNSHQKKIYRPKKDFNDVKKIDSKFQSPNKELLYNHHFFSGKKVIITGDLIYFKTRNELAQLLWDGGAIIEKNYNSTIDVLIVGKSNIDSLKLKSSYYLNIKVIPEEELLGYFPDFKPYSIQLNSKS